VSLSPRLADVARAAGVSVATASRALSGRGSVAPETSERVRRVAATLEFEPSAAGRTLRTRSTRMIGFVVPDVSSAFYANALKGAQHRLRAAGYQITLMDTDERPDREGAALRALAAGRVDGIILCPASNDVSLVRAIERRTRLPIVLFDNVLDGAGAGRVTLANEAGIRLLVGHLVEVHGHRRIGYVGGIETETSGAERLAGYELAMLGNGLPIDRRWVRPGDWTEAAGRAETAALLALDQPISAIVYPCADLALGGLGELRARGVRVPDEVAIVCFDDTGAGPLLDPPLTALARRDREIGDVAAAMVLRALETSADGTSAGSAAPMDVRIPMELAIRRSCGCGAPTEAGASQPT
jgi:DNA-binding LacI/PurR family transcriptional regulator